MRGSAFGDVLTGSNSAGAPNGQDFESFEGREGDDTIDGQGGFDRVDYNGVASAISVNLALGTASDGYGDTDTLSNIEAIRGSSFDDVLTGGAIANGVGATDGFEGFNGGAGNDTIDGGAGYDRAEYQFATSAVNVTLSYNGLGAASDGQGGFDTLIDIEAVRGSSFNDTLTGSDTSLATVAENFESFEGLGGNDTINGLGGFDRVDYANAAGAVIVNLAVGTASDGQGGNDSLISIEGVRGSGLNDQITGAATADNLSGNGGNDTVDGGDGNDTLDGSTGDDSLLGGAGHDGLDGGAGNDTLNGGAGQDTLTGSAGNDVLDGGVITDLVNYTDLNFLSYAGAGAGTTINLQTGTASDGSGGVDSLANLNFIVGSAFADSITGSSGIFFEQFEGGLGDDTIDGGAIDAVTQSNSNRVSYLGASGAVTVDLGAGTATGGAGNDTLVNINHVRGSTFGDTLLGSNNTVLTEQFEGRQGNDTIDGQGGNDMVRYDAATAAVNVNLVTGVAVDGQGGTDTLFDIEGIRGSNFNDVITGGNAANGIGATDGLEFYIGNAGNDTIDGGEGYDRADYTTSTAGVTVTLNYNGTGTANDGLGGVDALINIEAVRGSAFADTLTGSDTSLALAAENFESFEGREGNDTINGLGGFDRVDYSSSAGAVVINLASGTASDGYGSIDTLIGIEGIRGSAFNDQITGSGNADRLSGNGGNDSLTGGLGLDVFQFEAPLSAAGNVDTITDFAVGEKIWLDNDVFIALGAPATLGAAQFFSGAGLTGSTAAGQGAGIYYNSTAGSLYYDADGFGGAASVQFAVVTGNPVLSASNFEVRD